ncbi:hypothetical protein CB1_000548001 [Camelus ferus]|nr:hypothetical protein CB1_000548001 [Camelus ferus]
MPEDTMPSTAKGCKGGRIQRREERSHETWTSEGRCTWCSSEQMPMDSGLGDGRELMPLHGGWSARRPFSQNTVHVLREEPGFRVWSTRSLKKLSPCSDVSWTVRPVSLVAIVLLPAANQRGAVGTSVPALRTSRTHVPRVGLDFLCVPWGGQPRLLSAPSERAAPLG